MLKKYFTQNNLLLLFVVVALGFVLRVYKISSNYYFSGELGKELLYIREFAVNQQIPLTGMGTSHEWLNYGPLYYWIMIPFYNLLNGNPYILFWAALAVSTFGLIVNYLVVKEIIDTKVALISTTLQAVSPLLIWQTRLSKLHAFFFLLMPLFMFSMFKLWNGDKKWLFIAGLIYGVMFSFHFSQIPILIVVILLFWYKKEFYKFKDWVTFGIGVLLPNIPLLLHNKNLVFWVPYRIIKYGGRNLTNDLLSLNEYLGKNIFWDKRIWFIGTLLFVLLFVLYFQRHKNEIGKSFVAFYLITTIAVTILACTLHGGVPVHYYLPIFTTVPIMYSIYLKRVKLWYIAPILLLVINIPSFMSNSIFYGDNDKEKPIDYVSYSTQLKTASFIVNNAKGSSFSIERVGAFDHFPEYYSQNYKYLVLWKGGKLTEDSGNVYTIIESENGVNVQK